MELKQHQSDIVRKVPDKHGLWLRPRVGKTPTSISLAAQRCKSCLVIVPKHIKEQWENEIEKWNNSDCQFIVITKERFRIDSIKEIKKRGRGQTIIFSDKVPVCDAVIVDEVHRQASNHTNKFFKCLNNYISANSLQYVWLLSGTPWNKNPWSVYAYATLLGQHWNFVQYRSVFFTEIRAGLRNFFKPNEKKFPKLVEILQKLGVTVRLEDITGEIEDLHEVEYFDLTVEQNRHIKAITDTNPLARFTKRHQLEQGTLKSDGYKEDLSFDCEKDNRILEIAEDEDKLIIVCRYLDQIDKIEKILSPLERKIFIIRGQEKESASIIASRAEKEDKAIVIIQAECSDGYDLKSFKHIVFASMSWSFVSYDQMTQRVKSMSKTDPCHYTYLVTRGKSVDKGVYDSVMKGQDFNEELYARK